MNEQELIILSVSLIAVTLLLAASALLISYLTYAKIFKRRRREYDPLYGLDKPAFLINRPFLESIIERIKGEPCEIIEITAYDGVRLAAKYYHSRDGAPIHAIFHGYKSSPERDGSGGGCDALDLGHNLLLVYERAHGMSEGETISFGIRERYDVLSCMNYLTERFGKDSEIILIGTSMGGASVLMASELPLPATVKCIIADCPYSVPKDIILNSAKRMGYPTGIIYPFIRLGARIFGGFDLEAASAEEAIRSAKIPIIIAHGEGDSVVPVEMSRKMAAVAAETGVTCHLKTFEGAEHCMSFIVYYEEYTAWRNELLRMYIRSFDNN
jgi:pimeloyl-ACP methyl ester carboxylesterase